MPSSPAIQCRDVTAAVSAFLDQGPRSGIDLSRLGPHSSSCADCFKLLTTFFEKVRLPESTYLRETLQDLSGSLHNLARALMQEAAAELNRDESSALIRITGRVGGTREQHLEAGEEALEDVLDYGADDSVAGLSLPVLRDLLADAKQGKRLRDELAEAIFASIVKIDGSQAGEAWNWIGALRYRRQEYEAAVTAYRSAIAAGGRNAYPYCGLAYSLKNLGRLDEAVHAAEASIERAGIENTSPYFGHLAAVYVYLLRASPSDIAAARASFEMILADTSTSLLDDLRTESNAPVRRTILESELGSDPRLDPLRDLD